MTHNPLREFPHQVKQYPDAEPPPYAAPLYPQPASLYPHPAPVGPTIVTTGTPTVMTATVVSGGAVVVTSAVGPNPARIVCRSCNAEIVTRVESTPSMRTHLMAGLLCLLGAWCCVCIPYCMDSCMNADHYCPNCNSFIGTYRA